MKFADLDNTMQEEILELLGKHITMSTDILKQDRRLLPMLMIPDTNQIVGLQPKVGAADVDKAYAHVIEKLKNETFTYALFSYSTRVGLTTGRECDAVKTCIFTKNGMQVTFFTPFTVNGLFKKSVNIEKTIFAEIKENVFD